MNIKSAEFIKGVVGEDPILTDGLPQVAFMGRSNVGKSSLINTLTGKKELARSSPTPGHTRQINFFLVNKSFYLVDLPGYGFAKGSKDEREALKALIEWYLLDSGVEQKAIILIVDAEIGVTDSDDQILGILDETQKNIIIVANKIDKIKKGHLKKHLDEIETVVHPFPVIPFSAKEKIGISDLLKQII